MSPQCPCGNPLPFSQCCEPLLLNHQAAQTPEQLMRSRYSAFVQKNKNYLLHTHHPDARSPQLAQSLQHTFNHSRWLSLRVIDAPPPNHERGEVEFVAFYREQIGPIQQIHERSEFNKFEGQWVYSKGDHLPALKLSRNDPCPCGSGKKLKKCCSV